MRSFGSWRPNLPRGKRSASEPREYWSPQVRRRLADRSEPGHCERHVRGLGTARRDHLPKIPRGGDWQDHHASLVEEVGFAAWNFELRRGSACERCLNPTGGGGRLGSLICQAQLRKKGTGLDFGGESKIMPDSREDRPEEAVPTVASKKLRIGDAPASVRRLEGSGVTA